MRLRTSLTAVAIAATAVLALSACTTTGDTTDPDDVTFEAGTTMAALNEAGTITIGTKFD